LFEHGFSENWRPLFSGMLRWSLISAVLLVFVGSGNRGRNHGSIRRRPEKRLATANEAAARRWDLSRSCHAASAAPLVRDTARQRSHAPPDAQQGR